MQNKLFTSRPRISSLSRKFPVGYFAVNVKNLTFVLFCGNSFRSKDTIEKKMKFQITSATAWSWFTVRKLKLRAEAGTRAKGKFAKRKTLIWIRLYMELMEKIKNIQTSPFRTLETNCDAQDQEVPVWRRCEVYRKWSYWCPPLKSTPPALCIIDAHMKVAPKCYEIAKAIKIIGFVQFLAWETSLRLVHWLYLDHLVANYRPVS